MAVDAGVLDGQRETGCSKPIANHAADAARRSLPATGDRLSSSAPIPTDTPEFWLMPASESGAITGSVTDGSDAAPIKRWRAAYYRQDPAATDVGMHRPDWRVEPQPQQVTTRVLRRVAVVESGARMQDRVDVDEIRLARLQREFEHELRPLRHRLERVDDGAFRRAHR